MTAEALWKWGYGPEMKMRGTVFSKPVGKLTWACCWETGICLLNYCLQTELPLWNANGAAVKQKQSCTVVQVGILISSSVTRCSFSVDKKDKLMLQGKLTGGLCLFFCLSLFPKRYNYRFTDPYWLDFVHWMCHVQHTTHCFPTYLLLWHFQKSISISTWIYKIYIIKRKSPVLRCTQGNGISKGLNETLQPSSQHARLWIFA